MVKVNLLPPKERTKKQVIKENFIAIVLSIIAVSIIAGFSFFLTLWEVELGGKVKGIEHDITAQKDKNNKYKDAEEAITNLNKNIERVKTLQKQYPKWSVALDEIRNKTPNNVILQDLSVASVTTTATTTTQDTASKDSSQKETAEPTKKETKPSQQPIIMTMKGLAPNHYSMMKLKELLSTSSSFTYVDFESSGWKQEKNQYEFVLKIQLKV